jgi:hypothetical protein
MNDIWYRTVLIDELVTYCIYISNWQSYIPPSDPVEVNKSSIRTHPIDVDNNLQIIHHEYEYSDQFDMVSIQFQSWVVVMCDNHHGIAGSLDAIVVDRHNTMVRRYPK